MNLGRGLSTAKRALVPLLGLCDRELELVGHDHGSENNVQSIEKKIFSILTVSFRVLTMLEKKSIHVG